MQLDVGAVTRSRVIVINEDTLERGRSYTDAPCGCLVCCNRHEGGRWTHRQPHATVYRLRGALFCEEHIDARIREYRAARESA